MCMEDINIGRKTVGATRSETVDAGVLFHIPSNGRRVGLFIATSGSADVTVFSGNVQNATKQVLFLPTELPYLMMRVEEWGRMVQESFTLQNVSAAMVACYTEFILNEEK